jgi:hypothetical protein
MQSDVDAGEALRNVARIHPVVDRLRRLLASAVLLDLMASSDGYWTARPRGSGVSRRPAR